jgi:hypothetical protein
MCESISPGMTVRPSRSTVCAPSAARALFCRADGDVRRAVDRDSFGDGRLRIERDDLAVDQQCVRRLGYGRQRRHRPGQ